MQTSDIYSVTDFNRRPAEHIKRVQETKNPEVLTVNGKAAVVMIDPDTYDQLTQDAEFSRTLEQIMLADAQHKAGKSKPLDHAFGKLKERLKAKYPDASL